MSITVRRIRILHSAAGYASMEASNQRLECLASDRSPQAPAEHATRQLAARGKALLCVPHSPGWPDSGLLCRSHSFGKQPLATAGTLI